jgi:hypothetical protein
MSTVAPRNELRNRAEREHQPRAADRRELPVVTYPAINGKPNPQTWTLRKLERELTRCFYHTPRTRPKQGRCFSLVEIADEELATDDNVTALSGLVLDIDGGTSRSQIETALKAYLHYGYSTYSHTAEQERYRLVLPLAVPHDPALLAPMYDWIAERGLSVDRTCCNPARKFLLPERPANAEFVCWKNDGGLLDLSDLEPPKRKRRNPILDVPGVSVQGKHFTQDPKQFSAIMAALGAPEGTRARQKITSLVCTDNSPSTWFFVGKNGHLLYQSRHARTVTDFRDGTETAKDAQSFTQSCAEVLASRHYGRIVRFMKPKQPEHRLWDLRLQYKLGLLQPVSVPHDAIDLDDERLRDWSPGDRLCLWECYDGFVLLVGLKAAHNGRGIEATPCAWRLGAAWCGLRENYKRFGKMLDMLMKLGLIHSTETFTSSYGSTMHLLLPQHCRDK